jgi:hypothetical protein
MYKFYNQGLVMIEQKQALKLIHELVNIIDGAMAEHCMGLIKSGMHEGVVANIAISAFMSSMMRLIHELEHEDVEETLEQIHLAIAGLHSEYMMQYESSEGMTIN